MCDREREDFNFNYINKQTFLICIPKITQNNENINLCDSCSVEM